MKTQPEEPRPRRHRIELNLRDINQFFNTMDPSPFRADLDHDAEEFHRGVGARIPVREPVELGRASLRMAGGAGPAGHDRRAVRHYFDYRARLNWLDLRRLMREGSQSLLIGVCSRRLSHGSEALSAPGTGGCWGRPPGVEIAGWVAMWRPMEIYLYEWWPVRRRGTSSRNSPPCRCG